MKRHSLGRGARTATAAFAILFFAGAVQAAPDSSGAAREALGGLPLIFEPNPGPDGLVQGYAARAAGYQVTVGQAETALHLVSRKPAPLRNKLENGTRRPAHAAGEAAIEVDASATVRLRLRGGSGHSVVTAENRLPGSSNYYLGDNPAEWRTNVPQYARVRAKSVYPGIDMVLYGSQGQLEYDFEVGPGRDPTVIELELDGVDGLRLDESGDLILMTSAGEVRQRRPTVYQAGVGGRTLVGGEYELRGEHRIGFRLANYDRTRPLVIDPILTFSTYLGGSLFDELHGVDEDAQGNVYISGTTRSSNFSAIGALRSRSGPSDAVALKVNIRTLSVVYVTFLGGSSDEDFFNWIAADSSGAAYIGGYTQSTNFPTMQPIQGTNRGGLGDAFATKLAANGTLVYSTYLGGGGDDFVEGMAVDSSGALYLSGGTDSTNFPTVSPRQGSYGGGEYDGFLTKINPSGNALIFSTYHGGSGMDFCDDVAVDGQNAVFVTGSTSSPNFPTTSGAFRQSGAGGSDAYLTKLNPAGATLLFSTRLGGSLDDYAISVEVDAAGAAYVTGSTQSTNFPVLSGPQTRPGGQQDVFVTKVAPDGASLVYSTYLGGSQEEFANQLRVNRYGEAYVIGSTSSGNFPLRRAIRSTKGGEDAFLTKLTASGAAWAHSTFIGGSGEDIAIGLALEEPGAALIVGYTGSSNLQTVSPFQAIFRGGDGDGMALRIDEAATVSGASYLGPELAAASIASVFSLDMSTATEAATSVPLPTMLAGASVSVTDSAGVERPAQLFVVTPGQINFYIPEETALGPAIITVTASDGARLRQAVLIVGVAPALFSANASGAGVAAAGVLRVKADGTQTVEEVAVYNQQTQAFVSKPIDMGPATDQIYLLMYGTGLRAAGSAMATVGGTTVPVIGPVAQGQFIGLDQANLGPIPRTLIGRGEVEVALTAGGKAANKVKVRFQ